MGLFTDQLISLKGETILVFTEEMRENEDDYPASGKRKWHRKADR